MVHIFVRWQWCYHLIHCPESWMVSYTKESWMVTITQNLSQIFIIIIQNSNTVAVQNSDSDFCLKMVCKVQLELWMWNLGLSS